MPAPFNSIWLDSSDIVFLCRWIYRRRASDHFECQDSASNTVPVNPWGFLENTVQELNELRERGYHELTCDSITTTATTTTAPKKCKRLCYYSSTNMQHWRVKCMWKSCSGCPECSLSECFLWDWTYCYSTSKKEEHNCNRKYGWWSRDERLIIVSECAQFR